MAVAVVVGALPGGALYEAGTTEPGVISIPVLIVGILGLVSNGIALSRLSGRVALRTTAKILGIAAVVGILASLVYLLGAALNVSLGTDG